VRAQRAPEGSNVRVRLARVCLPAEGGALLTCNGA
jgi:hypothetical protein